MKGLEKKLNFLQQKPSKKMQRMLKARERIYNRKTSEISKARAVQYATAAFVMAMHELYGWSAVRSGRVIESARALWGSYTSDTEKRMIRKAKELGVDVEGVTKLALNSKKPDALNMPAKAYSNFQCAIDDVHLMMSACLIVLHTDCGYGERRLNCVMNHMWQQYLKACTVEDKSIMQLCEDETGIVIAGAE